MAVKIEKKITGFAVASNEEQAAAKPVTAAPAPLARPAPELLKRPDVLCGRTYKIKPPSNDAIYICINDMVIDEGLPTERLVPFEIFINSKNMENFQWVVSMTRMISAVFRHGGDSSFLVQELKSVKDPNGGYFKKGGKFMSSIVAEIGEVIESHMESIGFIQKDNSLADAAKQMLAAKQAQAEAGDTKFSEPKGSKCHKCGEHAVVLSGGCEVCTSCGDSKCS